MTLADESTRVPNSGGTSKPRLQAPPGTCDSHMHLFDPSRPRAQGSTGLVAEHATADDYRVLQRRLGIERAVIVTPRYYGTDNTVTLDGIDALGRNRTRGVAVVAPDIGAKELRALHEGGIRGVRFSTPHVESDHPVFANAAALAPRLEEAGMHLQLHWMVAQIVAHANLLLDLPCTVVIDHMGRLPVGIGMEHPAYDIVRRRLDCGRTWIKLSGWYLDSVGPPYRDAVKIGTSFARAAPERMVWGTDWPHVTEQAKPDGAFLLDVLEECVPDPTLRRRILVDNPAQLYGFS